MFVFLKAKDFRAKKINQLFSHVEAIDEIKIKEIRKPYI